MTVLRTWHVEMFVVDLVLFGVYALSGSAPIEALGVAAVLLSFGHAQVTERLRERDAARTSPAVACHAWSTRYLVGKEALWCAYFVVHGAWTALAGVGLFILYPVWRGAWRRAHPLPVMRVVDPKWRTMDTTRRCACGTAFDLLGVCRRCESHARDAS